MAKQGLREHYVESIMKKKYGSDDTMHDEKHRDFLESLSIRELESMLNSDDDGFGDEHELADEIYQIDEYDFLN